LRGGDLAPAPRQLFWLTVDGPGTIAKLASRPGKLTTVQIDALWRHLGTSLPQA
jgi:hypothetical protein